MSEEKSAVDLSWPTFVLPRSHKRTAASALDHTIQRHWQLLSAVTPDAADAKPYMMVTVLPKYEPSQASSSRNDLAEARYDEIVHDLNAIKKGEMTDEVFEIGAVDTAKALVSQIRNRQIAPPELNWLGNEAIIMLWVIGKKKLALTITDGEIGYTLRDNGRTVQRKSNISPESFDLLRIK